MHYLFLAFLLLFSLSCSHVEESDHPKYVKLDKNFDLIKEYEKGRGAVAILHKRELVYTRHFGPEEIEEPVYRIGSVSKMYTAAIILKLIEEKRLSLNTKLSSFYKDIHQAGSITIEHLLGHRSGLPDFTSRPGYLEYFQKPTLEKDQISRFESYRLEFEPGERYKYSNTGYVLLSYIAQQVTSLDFSQLFRKYIATPLSLERTYVYRSQEPRAYEVKSYEKVETWERASNTHETVPMGAGSIASTPREVAIFIRALFKGEIISPKLVDKMIDLKDGYGLGVTAFPYDEKRLFGHSGGIDGFSSIVGYIKEDDLAIVQLTNAMAMNFNDNSIAMLASFYGDQFELPDFKESIKLPVDVLNRYVGTFTGKGFPLKLTFTHENGILLGKASGPGQSEVSFEAISEREFSYFRAGIELKFSPDGEELEFTQGETFSLQKE